MKLIPKLVGLYLLMYFYEYQYENPRVKILISIIAAIAVANFLYLAIFEKTQYYQDLCERKRAQTGHIVNEAELRNEYYFYAFGTTTMTIMMFYSESF